MFFCIFFFLFDFVCLGREYCEYQNINLTFYVAHNRLYIMFDLHYSTMARKATEYNFSNACFRKFNIYM